MGVSFIAANLNSGGAERVMSLLANQFIENGYEVEFVFLKEDIRFYPLPHNVKIKVVEKECGSDSLIKKLLWMRKYFKQNKPDVIFAFRIAVYCATLLSLLGVKVPVIASERNDPRFNSLPWKVIQAVLLPLAKHLVVQTQQIKNYFPQFIQKKTTVIINPVRDDVFKNPCIDSRVQSSNAASSVESSKQNRIISVARLDSQKNQQMMIRAFAKIAEEYSDWQLVIFGEGPLRATLELLISSLKLQGRVLLPGRTEQVIDELHKSKIFCFSSDFEGLSNSMIEALCVGLPIVTTNVSGTEDILVDGENGFIVPVNDEDAMAHSLRVLMADEQMMKKMGEQNRQKAHLFSIENIYAQWEKLIQSVVKDGN